MWTGRGGTGIFHPIVFLCYSGGGTGTPAGSPTPPSTTGTPTATTGIFLFLLLCDFSVVTFY